MDDCDSICVPDFVGKPGIHSALNSGYIHNHCLSVSLRSRVRTSNNFGLECNGPAEEDWQGMVQFAMALGQHSTTSLPSRKLAERKLQGRLKEQHCDCLAVSSSGSSARQNHWRHSQCICRAPCEGTGEGTVLLQERTVGAPTRLQWPSSWRSTAWGVIRGTRVGWHRGAGDGGNRNTRCRPRSTALAFSCFERIQTSETDNAEALELLKCNRARVENRCTAVRSQKYTTEVLQASFYKADTYQ